MGQAQGIRGDPPSVGLPSCPEGGCSQRMPWQGWSFGPGVHAWPHAWQVLLASHGCPGKRVHWEVSPMSWIQSQAAKIPLENIMATHPLELVHLDYLCLECGKGLDENVLVVTDHFTRYTQAYVTRTITTQMNAITIWDRFIVHYGMPEKILMDQGQNFESVGGWPLQADGDVEYMDQSIPSTNQWPVWEIQLWSTYLGPYPRRRSQSGGTTLECWFMHTTAPKIQVQGSSPTTSCLGDNLTFQ